MAEPQPRDQLAQALSNWLTPGQMTKLIDEVLSIEKRASVEIVCKWCHRHQRHYGSVPDAKAVSSALTELLTQAYGRPGEEAHQAEPIQFKRYSVSDLDVPAVPDPKQKSKQTGRPRKTVGRPKPA